MVTVIIRITALIFIGLLLAVGACNSQVTPTSVPPPQPSASQQSLLTTSAPPATDKSVIIPPVKGGINTFFDKQPPYSGQSGEQVKIINNAEARKQTLEQVILFLKKDKTDQDTYGQRFEVTADFAEKVHNNAEGMGIKAAWVAIGFSDTHESRALNAFETTDNGLVFIDCTGESPIFITPPIDIRAGKMNTEDKLTTDSYDKIAFVEIGKEYGLISLGALSYPGINFSPDYRTYLSYKQKMDDNEIKVKEFNSKVIEYAKMQQSFNADFDDYEKSLPVEQYHLDTCYLKIKKTGTFGT